MELAQIADAIRDAHDRQVPLRIRGAGSKDFYGGMLAGDVLDVGVYKGIVAYEPTELYITAKCGTPLAEIEAALAEKNQMLAFEPPHFSGATVGGYTLGSAETPGASGDGLLVTLRWKAKGTGDTELKLENLQLAGANGAALEGQVSAEPVKVTIGGSSSSGLPTGFVVPLLVIGAVLVVALVGYFLLARRQRTTT